MRLPARGLQAYLPSRDPSVPHCRRGFLRVTAKENCHKYPTRRIFPQIPLRYRYQTSATTDILSEKRCYGYPITNENGEHYHTITNDILRILELDDGVSRLFRLAVSNADGQDGAILQRGTKGTQSPNLNTNMRAA